jgi:hypothetical protein
MTIRLAGSADVDAVAGLAHENRIRQQGWDPEFWSMSPSARQVHPMLLRVAIESTAGVALVSESADRIDGYLLASAAPDPRAANRSLWVVDDIGVASARAWHSVAPALLAAAAARRDESTMTAMVTGCPHGDHDRALMLIASGFRINCWFRTRRLAERRSTVASVADGDGTDDLPLPHLHGLTAALRGARMVKADAAGGMVSAPLPSQQLSAERGATALADPVVAGSRAATVDLVAAIELECAERGDSTLIVACGPGEPMLDDVLDERGYGRPIDWHALQW